MILILGIFRPSESVNGIIFQSALHNQYINNYSLTSFIKINNWKTDKKIKRIMSLFKEVGKLSSFPWENLFPLESIIIIKYIKY